MSISEERMYPPVRIIINTLQATFPACHWNFIHILQTNIFEDCSFKLNITSITTLQMVSMGIVMKEITASARVRWKTRKCTLVRLTRSTLSKSNCWQSERGGGSHFYLKPFLCRQKWQLAVCLPVWENNGKTCSLKTNLQKSPKEYFPRHVFFYWKKKQRLLSRYIPRSSDWVIFI